MLPDQGLGPVEEEGSGSSWERLFRSGILLPGCDRVWVGSRHKRSYLLGGSSLPPALSWSPVLLDAGRAASEWSLLHFLRESKQLSEGPRDSSEAVNNTLVRTPQASSLTPHLVGEETGDQREDPYKATKWLPPVF